jgi:hypothetical protein
VTSLGAFRNPDCRKPLRRRNGRQEGAWDYCWGCYHRWDRAGRPDMVPPPRPRGGDMIDAAGRREEYACWRALGWTPAEAADQVGVSVRTRDRYERAYQAQEHHQEEASAA